MALIRVFGARGALNRPTATLFSPLFSRLLPQVSMSGSRVISRGFQSTSVIRSTPRETAKSEKFSFVRLAGVLVAVSVVGGYLQWEKTKALKKKQEEEDEKRRRVSEEGEDKPEANLSAMGGPFTLTDENGQRKTEQDFRGKFVLMYFGYTFCPDICPSELKKMADSLDLLKQEMDPAEAESLVLPAFVSVDPHRDSLEQIKVYTKDFHPRLLGLTGTEEELKVIAKAYGVYVKIPTAEDREKDKEYIVDHSIFTFLIGPDGNLLDYYSHEMMPAAMAKSMARKIRQWKAKQAKKSA